MPKTLSGPETLTFGDIPHIKLFLSTDAVQSNFKDYHHPSINGIYLRYVSPKKYQSHPNTNRCEKAHPPARPKKATGANGRHKNRLGGTDEDSFNGITLDVPGFVGIGPPWPPP